MTRTTIAVNANDSITMKNNKTVIYTDGSCIHKKGGLGFVVITNSEMGTGDKVDIVDKYAYPVPLDICTNQIAELYAILSAIATVDGPLMIYSDSMYSIKSLTIWNKNWSKNGWKNSKGKPVANKEIIQSILGLMAGRDIQFKHVKAHNGDKYNEMADRLANYGREMKV